MQLRAMPGTSVGVSGWNLAWLLGGLSSPVFQHSRKQALQDSPSPSGLGVCGGDQPGREGGHCVRHWGTKTDLLSPVRVGQPRGALDSSLFFYC